MKYHFEKIVLLFAFALMTINVNAQRNTFATSATVGVSLPATDSGIGIHLGLNPSILVSEYIAIEGQISYVRTKLTDSFLSGDVGAANAFNILAGPKFYLKKVRKIRKGKSKRKTIVLPYINAMAGAVNSNKEVKGVRCNHGFDFGYAFGGGVEIGKLVISAAYETPGNIVFKGGYSF